MKQKARSETAFKDDIKEHAFCDTQPIPHAGAALPEGAIVPNKPRDEPRTAPYNMPTGFEWSDVDYVEDDDCLFRFDYSRDFLEWALMPPGWRKEFLLGVRSSAKKVDCIH
jgi:glycylpeptide N-tetradecanoyltransferase